MADKQEQKKTPEQIKAEKEAKRESALATLQKTNFPDLAAAFYTERAGQYGQSADALRDFIYEPVMEKSGKLIMDALRASRKGGRYSGSTTEEGVIESAAGAVYEALTHVTVADVLKIMGSEKDLGEDYSNMYLRDLMTSDSKEAKGLAYMLIGASDENGNFVPGEYQSYLMDTKMAAGLTMRSEKRVGDLETMLTKPKEGEGSQ